MAAYLCQPARREAPTASVSVLASCRRYPLGDRGSHAGAPQRHSGSTRRSGFGSAPAPAPASAPAPARDTRWALGHAPPAGGGCGTGSDGAAAGPLEIDAGPAGRSLIRLRRASMPATRAAATSVSTLDGPDSCSALRGDRRAARLTAETPGGRQRQLSYTRALCRHVPSTSCRPSRHRHERVFLYGRPVCAFFL